MSDEASKEFQKSVYEKFSDPDMPPELTEHGANIHRDLYEDGWGQGAGTPEGQALRAISGEKLCYDRTVGYGDDDPVRLKKLQDLGDGAVQQVAKRYGVTEDVVRKVADIDHQISQVYRGVAGAHLDSQGAQLRGGQKARVHLDALSSWTTDQDTARAFARDGAGVVLKMRVAKTDVFSTSLSLRNTHEAEFVVRGGIRDVQVIGTE
jgi:catechol 2,3-dioxygenase-like lactoylglutathione lyase family enzyme